MIKLEKMVVGMEFCDSQIENIDNLDLRIVEDHVYTISNGVRTVVIVEDEGNGNGKVIKIETFNSPEELFDFIKQDWKKYIKGMK